MARRLSLGRIEAEHDQIEAVLAQMPIVRSQRERLALARHAHREGAATFKQMLLLCPTEVIAQRRCWDEGVMVQLAMRRAGMARLGPAGIAHTFHPEEPLPDKPGPKSAVSGIVWEAKNSTVPPADLEERGHNVRKRYNQLVLWSAAWGDEEAMAYRRSVWHKIDGRWELRPHVLDAARRCSWKMVDQHRHGSVNPRVDEVLEWAHFDDDATAYDFAIAIDQFRREVGFEGRDWSHM